MPKENGSTAFRQSSRSRFITGRGDVYQRLTGAVACASSGLVVVVVVINVFVFANRWGADDVVLTVAVILIIVEIATDDLTFIGRLKASVNVALLHGSEG